jgi:glycerol-3-phosphate acyltransferase PlsX
MDPRRYNGAVFMGVNGVAVKSHGGTDALGFANAVGVAADMARYDLVECIKQDVRLLSVENDRAADNAEGGS